MVVEVCVEVFVTSCGPHSSPHSCPHHGVGLPMSMHVCTQTDLQFVAAGSEVVVAVTVSVTDEIDVDVALSSRH